MTTSPIFHGFTLAVGLALAGLAAGSLVACASTETSESSGEYLDDSVLSGKVASAIIGDKDLSIFQINVETYKGVVQLSGFVNSEAIKHRAGAVARSVNGVAEVHNNLVTK